MAVSYLCRTRNIPRRAVRCGWKWHTARNAGSYYGFQQETCPINSRITIRPVGSNVQWKVSLWALDSCLQVRSKVKLRKPLFLVYVQHPVCVKYGHHCVSGTLCIQESDVPVTVPLF